MTLEWKTSYASLHQAGEAEFPPACLHYLLQVLRTAPPADAGTGVSPKELTMHFRRQSRLDFGPLLPMVLREWGLTGPAEFGRGILLLARQGCINLGPDDALESFIRDDARPFVDA